MPRCMSFSMTTEPVRRHEKTVTRRLGWRFLKPGDLLWAVEKAQGLKRGEKVKRLGLIRVKSVRWAPLDEMPCYGQAECTREGFPQLTPEQFMAMFLRVNRAKPFCFVNRIEFEYVEESAHERL